MSALSEQNLGLIDASNDKNKGEVMRDGPPRKADGYDATKPAKRNNNRANRGFDAALDKAATFEEDRSAFNKRKDSVCIPASSLSIA
ncbi:MAG TPA: hypothetical protein VKP67_16485 [Xanthobacteraceae bacterium]|nr:hypothetical protein [Xanthobacteraceae bacterium]